MHREGRGLRSPCRAGVQLHYLQLAAWRQRGVSLPVKSTLSLTAYEFFRSGMLCPAAAAQYINEGIPSSPR